MNHHIDGHILIPRRRAKREFRQSILDAWNHCCAYCGKPATTLDHVRPRSKGGETKRSNLISCCANCNSRKGSYEWVEWFRLQPFWSAEQEGTIWIWLHQDDESENTCYATPVLIPPHDERHCFSFHERSRSVSAADTD